VDSGGPKEAQVQLYSPGGANVPSLDGTFAQPGEGFDCLVRLTVAILTKRHDIQAQLFDDKFPFEKLDQNLI